MNTLFRLFLAALMSFAVTAEAIAADYYVSANRGKGRKGSKEKPCKDIGNVIKKLQPGDTIHVAEGVYPGKSDSGYHWIKVPVSVMDDGLHRGDVEGTTVEGGDQRVAGYGVVFSAKLRAGLPPRLPALGQQRPMSQKPGSGFSFHGGHPAHCTSA